MTVERMSQYNKDRVIGVDFHYAMNKDGVGVFESHGMSVLECWVAMGEIKPNLKIGEVEQVLIYDAQTVLKAKER